DCAGSSLLHRLFSTWALRCTGFSRRKVTYIPPPPPDDEESIFAHYQTGINFDKYDTILVEVSGHDPPPAILTFEEANLCQILNKNIAKAGYTKLTPVQKYSIPIILGGRDLMACAQTGSGKTAAFLLPILAHMMRDGITASHSKELQEPECIIVAPTRELISQIYSEARKFSFGTCVRAVVTYGGTPLRHSIRQIVQGCNILCATPGRLMDIIGKEKTHSTGRQMKSMKSFFFFSPGRKPLCDIIRIVKFLSLESDLRAIYFPFSHTTLLHHCCSLKGLLKICSF
ncbi:hypothetical protein FD754_024725, partial [Muntiacus muntjak]